MASLYHKYEVVVTVVVIIALGCAGSGHSHMLIHSLLLIHLLLAPESASGFPELLSVECRE